MHQAAFRKLAVTNIEETQSATAAMQKSASHMHGTATEPEPRLRHQNTETTRSLQHKAEPKCLLHKGPPHVAAQETASTATGTKRPELQATQEELQMTATRTPMPARKATQDSFTCGGIWAARLGCCQF